MWQPVARTDKSHNELNYQWHEFRGASQEPRVESKPAITKTVYKLPRRLTVESQDISLQIAQTDVTKLLNHLVREISVILHWVSMHIEIAHVVERNSTGGGKIDMGTIYLGSGPIKGIPIGAVI